MSLPVSIRNELRRTMAIRGLDYVYSEKGETRFRYIWRHLEERYLGGSGIVSYCDQLLNGLSPFGKMFENRTDIVAGSSASSSASYVCLSLKSEYSRTEVAYILGRDIGKPNLEETSKKKKTLIKGKTLLTLANDGLADIRKALAILPTLDSVLKVDENGIECRSGTTIKDVMEELLDAMFTLLHKKKNNRNH